MTSSNLDALFRPFTIGSLELPNRIVMAPMSRYFAPDGVPGPANAAYYRRRAEGGVGLILSEGTVIDRPTSYNDPGIPFFHGEKALAGWQTVIDDVHRAGGRMGPQIWHTGSAYGISGWEPVKSVESPSGLVKLAERRGDPMNDEALSDTVAAYARAASDAKRLGFDTLELHGAHGYLIDEFFWLATNERSDRYGGSSLKERSRYAAEIVAAVRVAVGPNFPIIFRVSQFKMQDYDARVAQTPEEMGDWLQPLVDAGVDVLHCSQRRFWEAEFPDIDGPNGLNLAGWAKKLTGAATISVGSVGLASDFISGLKNDGTKPAGLDRLLARIEREEFDLIAVGRALISNPDWPMKVRVRETADLKDFDRTMLSELV